MSYVSCAVAPETLKKIVGSTKVSVVKKEVAREGLVVEVASVVVKTYTVPQPWITRGRTAVRKKDALVPKEPRNKQVVGCSIYT